MQVMYFEGNPDKETSIESLSGLCWSEANKFLHMQFEDMVNPNTGEISKVEIPVPYHLNEMSTNLIYLANVANLDEDDTRGLLDAYKKRGTIDYGSYRGKGSAEEIKNVVLGIMGKTYGSRFNSSGILTMMNRFGIGIDCSGLVYHILSSSLKKEALHLDNILFSGKDAGNKVGVNYANASLFAKRSVKLNTLSELQPTDLLFIKNYTGEYTHIALVLKQDQDFFILQSALTTNPPGVTLSKLVLNNEAPQFEMQFSMGEHWDNLWDEGRIEFRRINFFN